MEKILCDTGVISRYLKGEQNYILLIEDIGIDNIVISPIVRIELHRWLSFYNGLTARQRNYFKKFISSLKILHINEKI